MNKMHDWAQEVLEIIHADRQTAQVIRKRTGPKPDSKFSSGDNHIMQPVYHSLNFRDKKRPV